ncbi:MAG: PAS domain S-box protein [Lutibacter sp.]
MHKTIHVLSNIFSNMFNLKPLKNDEFSHTSQSHEKELLQLNRLYATLSQINHAIVRIQKKEPLLQEICDIAINYGEFRMAWIGLIDESRQFIRSAASSGEEQGYLSSIHIPLTDSVLGSGPTGEAVNEGHCVFCQDIATDPSMKPWREEALQRGFRASAAIPIRQNNKVIGAFMVYSAEKMVFDFKEKQLLEEIGTEISFALDMIEREKQRKLASEALKISENRFRELLENVHLISILLDNQGNLTFCNPYLLELTGYTAKEIIGTNWIEFMIPSFQKEKIKEIFKGHEKSEIVSHAENAILTKTGTLRTIRWSNTVLRDAAGKVAGTASIGEDITESRQAEQALKESEERLRLSTELAKVAVWEHNIANKNMSRSKNHDQLYGLEWQEKWDLDAFLNATYPDDREISTSTMQQSVAPGGSDNYTFDIRVVHPDKSIHWLNVTGQVVERDKVGQGVVIRGTLIEVTGRKNVESEIKKLNEELELRVKQRTKELQSAILELETFTYSVSHDLKAPLRGIDGYGKLLLDLYGAELNEEAKHFINTIRSSTQQMNQLIDDLLEYSRLERGQLTHENIPIKTFVADLVSLYRTVLEHNNFTVNLKVPDIEIRTDSKALRIAVRNLLENAIKFTKKQPNPSIEIGLNEGESFWLLYVKDNGIGFNMKYHDRIFEIFQRLHRAEDYKGTGIGLAMVHKAMQRINGNVWGESIPAQGSTFNLELPKIH